MMIAPNESIPLISHNTNQKTVPWWSLNLSQKIKLKHRLNRRLDRLDTRLKSNIKSDKKAFLLHNLVMIALEIECVRPYVNKISALIRKEIINNRKKSWQTYVEKFSETTSQTKLWQKFRKINGSFTYTRRTPQMLKPCRGWGA